MKVCLNPHPIYPNIVECINRLDMLADTNSILKNRCKKMRLYLFLTLALVCHVRSSPMDDMMYHPSSDPPSPIPERMPEPAWKAPKEYLEMRFHDIESRDHGCVDFPEYIAETFHCEYIWIKNKFSSAGISPYVVTVDFQYNAVKAKHDAWKPVTSWIEHISPWRVRGCAAIPGGKGGALSGGKLRWLALYNHTQTNQEQSGVIQWTSSSAPLTDGKRCSHVDFPQAFVNAPTVKVTHKANYGVSASDHAAVLWLKGVTQTGFELCWSEFNLWSGYHHDVDVHWYATSSLPSEDNASVVGHVTFPAGESYPADHHRLNNFYCKNVTLPYGYYPCPAVMIQPVEPSLAVCESPTVAWIAYWKNDTMTVCYRDQRGIMGVRKTDIEVHYMIYGVRDKCADLPCPVNKHCIHPTYDTVACGCWTECPDGGEKVCGTNMKTYKNKCQLEKEACENNNEFSYAHMGECQAYTMDHGREQLHSVEGCGGLYCKEISTRNNVWYVDAKINVQISVNWMNSMSSMASVHDATSSWIEDVKSTGFRACVMEAGRRDLSHPPYVSWFAYQGRLKNVMSQKIEVGEWRSGTHCVPIHERTIKQKPIPWQPPSCPSLDLNSRDKVDQDRWQYDSHLMSQIYGQHHHEWFKRMLMGYGVKKLNLTSGMEINGATLMMTVEHTIRSPVAESYKDAVNVWMEFDNATKEAYVCVRELQNFDGNHKGVQVHWSFFNGSMIENLGFSHHVKFKPANRAPMYTNYAFCKTQKYLPDGHDLIGDAATVLVSLAHKIPSNAAYESMKMYQRHNEEVKRGVPMGGDGFNEEKEIDSWMMPHMWRANLTGWRPHMRITKNTDYSVWIEGMNKTHLKVCQKSIFSGYHFEGVDVSVLILPDRCMPGYRLLKNIVCLKYMEECANHTDAGVKCSQEQAFPGAPEDHVDNYFLSYLAGQNSIQLAISDIQEEGKWVRDLGNPSPSNYTRWAPGYPTNDRSKNCVLQRGIDHDFTFTDTSCSNCMNYACAKLSPQLSCHFPTDYCNGCGKCTRTAPFTFQCDCIPPYTGARCQNKMM